MKIILFLFVFSFHFVSGQAADSISNLVLHKTKVNNILGDNDVEKKYRDTLSPKKNMSLYKYIGMNYRLPEVSGLKGKVVVDFIVDEYGSIGNFKIIEDVGHGAAEELIRVLKTTDKKWKPKMINGKPVKVRYYAPLSLYSK